MLMQHRASVTAVKLWASGMDFESVGKAVGGQNGEKADEWLWRGVGQLSPHPKSSGQTSMLNIDLSSSVVAARTFSRVRG